MRYNNRDPFVATSSISNSSDEDLIQDAVQLAWQIQNTNNKHKKGLLLDSLQKYHDEIHKERKKPYLWNKIKDCFIAYRAKDYEFSIKDT